MSWVKCILGAFVLLLFIFSCNSNDMEQKITFTYSLPVKIDEKIIEDTNVILKFHALQPSDSIVLRFMSIFSNEDITLGIGDAVYKTINVTTNMSIGYATAITIPTVIFKKTNLKIHMRGVHYVIPFKEGYHFIDIFINAKDEMSVNYNNSFHVLSNVRAKVSDANIMAL